LDLRLRRALDHGQYVSGGPVPQRARGDSQRHERDWRRARYDPPYETDRLYRRPLLVRTRADPRQPGALSGDGIGVAAGARHGGERAGPGAADLVQMEDALAEEL